MEKYIEVVIDITVMCNSDVIATSGEGKDAEGQRYDF